jgi:predicted ABC-type ATPase
MYVVAGANGAGKSTLTCGARDEFGVEPIDADAIQRQTGMSSAGAWSEGLRRCRAAMASEKTFLIETTLAGSDASRPSTYLALMQEAKARGYHVVLVFIALENADAHVARVADRVAAGMHNIPEERVRERYERSIETAADALRSVDHAILFDNSSVGEPFRPIFEIKNGTIVAQVEDLPTWARRLLRRFSSGVRKGNPMP